MFFVCGIYVSEIPEKVYIVVVVHEINRLNVERCGSYSATDTTTLMTVPIHDPLKQKKNHRRRNLHNINHVRN